MERGLETNPGIKTLVRLSYALKVSLRELAILAAEPHMPDWSHQERRKEARRKMGRPFPID
jgi:hypothetical protein